MKERKSMPIMLHIQTKVYQNNEFTEHDIELSGQMIQIKDVIYLRYNESMEGVDTEIPVTIKLMPDGQVQLIRSGDVRMKLRFVYQQRQETLYHTPFGMLDIATFTTNMRVSLKDNPYSGAIQIDYELFGGEEKIGVYHLNLSFTA
ncbi:hypothetical protein CBF34_01700 [Vagococcus penaei]|uniref:Uncharacterized protein n=1 Tax=Vagococcus penaei TaxID=633807 RepID=A0A1Q2D7I1_9ENTE|nr:DUF1934 domain-containing protein [Vagococcus penaei]AQP54348.1 hypothetical protein BW732_09010 [Vagococcus penaei]RSU06264.1 hypothetical protein CBF34_01700 [Vagococcus penaei]